MNLFPLDNVSIEVAASGKRECCTCDVVGYLKGTVSTLVCASLVMTGWLHQPRECALTEGVVFVPIELLPMWYCVGKWIGLPRRRFCIAVWREEQSI